MGRRSQGDLLTLLMHCPWWISVVCSMLIYMLCKWILPSLNFSNFMMEMFVGGLQQLAWFIAFIFLIPAPFAFYNAKQRAQLLDRQRNLDEVRSLSWREFEMLVAEAFRRQGFKVVENPSTGADGGVDIRVFANGELHLVQCKQWRSVKVGVSVIREMYGVLTSEGAASVIIVTAGMFTQEAHNFAKGKPIDLVDGPILYKLIADVQKDRSTMLPRQRNFVR